MRAQSLLANTHDGHFSSSECGRRIDRSGRWRARLWVFIAICVPGAFLNTRLWVHSQRGALSRGRHGRSWHIRCRAQPPRQQQEDSTDCNPWRDDPQGCLSQALKLVDTEWSLLQAEIDIATEVRSEQDTSSSSATGSGGWKWRQDDNRVPDLLMRSALDRLRPYCVPSDYIDIPPLAGAFNAVQARLGNEAGLVMNFLSGSQSLSKAGRAFWQAELYLRSLHDVAGEEDVNELSEKVQEQLSQESDDVQKAIRGSVLLARQNFITASRFGYFLARSQKRWMLEKQWHGSADAEQEDDEEMSHEDAVRMLRENVGKNELKNFINAWQKRADVIEKKKEDFTMEVFLGGLKADMAVEMVRPATIEANRAILLRATNLFGNERDLLRQFASGKLEQLQLSNVARQMLQIEAAAFGVHLFDAEEQASERYSHLLSFTTFGSRIPPENQ